MWTPAFTATIYAWTIRSLLGSLQLKTHLRRQLLPTSAPGVTALRLYVRSPLWVVARHHHLVLSYTNGHGDLIREARGFPFRRVIASVIAAGNVVTLAFRATHCDAITRRTRTKSLETKCPGTRSQLARLTIPFSHLPVDSSVERDGR